MTRSSVSCRLGSLAVVGGGSFFFALAGAQPLSEYPARILYTSPKPNAALGVRRKRNIKGGQGFNSSYL